jgi:hypothetical protein
MPTTARKIRRCCGEVLAVSIIKYIDNFIGRQLQYALANKQEDLI